MNTLRQTNRLVLASVALALAAASGPGVAQSGTGSAGGSDTTGMARSGEKMSDATTHVAKASRVLEQMMQDPGLAAVLKRSKGVFVVPDYGRVGVGVVGARGGAGVLLVRRGGTWANPAFYNMGGISAGLQAGVEAGSIALILNNQKAVNSFMQNNRFALNAGAGLTLVNWSAKGQESAGRGDITVWSDTEGLFAGAAVSITDVNFDEEETGAYYGRRVAARDVLSGKVSNPNAQALRQVLASAGGAGAARSVGSSGTGSATSGGTADDTRNQDRAGSRSSQGAGQQSSGASAKGAGTASGNAGQAPATFLLVPIVPPAQDAWMKNGCWAKLHDDPNFTGDTLSLSGPIDMPNMVGPFGIDWKGKISSIETGPKATLTIYDNENYRDPVSTFKPGQRVADVSKKMGFFDEMSSLKITCAKGKAASGDAKAGG